MHDQYVAAIGVAPGQKEACTRLMRCQHSATSGRSFSQKSARTRALEPSSEGVPPPTAQSAAGRPPSSPACVPCTCCTPSVLQQVSAVCGLWRQIYGAGTKSPQHGNRRPDSHWSRCKGQCNARPREILPNSADASRHLSAVSDVGSSSRGAHH